MVNASIPSYVKTAMDLHGSKISLQMKSKVCMTTLLGESTGWMPDSLTCLCQSTAWNARRRYRKSAGRHTGMNVILGAEKGKEVLATFSIRRGGTTH
jgi:hypothetical protein